MYLLFKYFAKTVNQLFMFDGDIAALELAEHNGRPLKLEQ